MPRTPRVLIIDDDLLILPLVRHHLRPIGAEVHLAMGGHAGVLAARERRPDLILLDVEMPDVSGFEVCRMLRQDPRTNAVPIVFLTASTDGADVAQCFELGAIDVVSKPYEPQILQARVRSAIRRQAFARTFERAASLDAETGLRTRGSFLEAIDGAIDQARTTTGGSFAVLCLEAVLDTPGGRRRFDDELAAAEIARRLVRSVRALPAARHAGAADAVARLGGHCFGVLLCGPGMCEDGRRIVQRLHGSLGTLAYDAPGASVVVLAGWCDGGPDVCSAEAVLRDADDALTRARRTPGDEELIIVRAEPGSSSGSPEPNRPGERARPFDPESRFRPVVDLHDESITAIEVQAAWTDDQGRGMCWPPSFDASAAGFGWQDFLGSVLEPAGETIAPWLDRWPDARRPLVTLRVPPAALREAHAVEDLRSRLDDLGLRAECVQVECAESELMAHPRTSMPVVEQLRDHGLRVLVDGVGPGRSLPVILRRFEIDAVRLDPVFVARSVAPRAAGIELRNLFLLGVDVGVDMIADGVDRQQDADRLREIGGRLGQGVALAPAVDAMRLERLLDREPLERVA